MTGMCELLDSGFLDRKSVAQMYWGWEALLTTSTTGPTVAERAAHIVQISSMIGWRRKPILPRGHDQCLSPSDSGNSNQPPKECFLTDSPKQTLNAAPFCTWMCYKSSTDYDSALSGRKGHHEVFFLKWLLFYEGISITRWKTGMGGMATVYVIKWVFRQALWPWNNEFSVLFFHCARKCEGNEFSKIRLLMYSVTEESIDTWGWG